MKTPHLFTFIWILFLCRTGTAGAPPINDAYSDATLLEGESISISASLAGATVETNSIGMVETSSPGDLSTLSCIFFSSPPTQSLWWRWKAPRAGIVYLSMAPFTNELFSCSPIVRVWYKDQIRSLFPFEQIPQQVVALASGWGTPPHLYWPILVDSGQELVIQMVGQDPTPCTFRLRMSPASAPILLEEPVSVSSAPLGSAVFYTRVIGALRDPQGNIFGFPALRLGARYQWFHGEEPIASATTASMLIRSVTSETAGSYHVVVTDDFGSVTSRVATVTMRDAQNEIPPEIQVRREAQYSLPVFTLRGETGAWYNILSSEDLIHWNAVDIQPVSGVETEDPLLNAPLGLKTYFAGVAYNGVPIEFLLPGNGEKTFVRAERYLAGCEACMGQLFALQLAKTEFARAYRKENTYAPSSLDLFPTFANPDLYLSIYFAALDCQPFAIALNVIGSSPVWPCPWWLGRNGEVLNIEALPDKLWNGARPR